MKFRKKPIIVEAEQFLIDKKPWRNDTCICRLANKGNPHIHTLDGLLTIMDGDWIIIEGKRKVYACKPDIFDLTYEPVEDE